MSDDGTSYDAPTGAEEQVFSGGGLTVTVRGSGLRRAQAAVLEQVRADGVAAKLAGGDTGLWGEDAQGLASERLAWLDLAETSRPLLEELRELRRGLVEEGIDRVVLCGMGGSSLAPEVICAAAGVELVVLDTTDAGQVRDAMAGLDRSVVVVSSKSGGTAETRSCASVMAAALEAGGLSAEEVGRRFVAVTDPGSGLAEDAEAAGYRSVVLADPDVGGRYSALTAFGLVPCALAGVDVEQLLDEAQALRDSLTDDDGPALALGAVVGGAATGAGGTSSVLGLVLASDGEKLPGLGDWAEQLVAESTGKEGRGVLPVVVESLDAPGAGPGADDVHRVLLTTEDGWSAAAEELTVVAGPLGAQLLAWEVATAVAGRVLEINPFDQPNVQESKDNTAAILEETGGAAPEDGEPAFTEGSVQVFGDAGLLDGATTLDGAVQALVRAVPDGGYLAVMAYLDRIGDHMAAQLRSDLAGRTARPVTFGWGPRFLHSTGQLHKGGPESGAFLQVTGAVPADVDVPGREWTMGSLQAAQAAGDVQALTGRGRPVLRVHLTDRPAGLPELLRAAGPAAAPSPDLPEH